MKKGIAFGSAGWRGRLDDGFTEENVARTAHVFVLYLSQEHPSSSTCKVAIGFDGRTSSRESASLIAKILSENGIQVLLSSGIVPTPVLSFAAMHNGCAAGIMVTGGDLPPEFNGIDFKGAYGGPFRPGATAKLEEFLSDPKERPDRSSHASHTEITLTDFLPDYLSHVQTLVDFSLLRSFAQHPKNNANVLVDSMGGAGQTIIEDILVGCGWRAQTLFGTPEARFFDRCPETVPKNLAALKYNVTVVDAQFGIATDGDGNRCSLVNNDGNWISPQDTTLALLWHLHQQRGGRGSFLKSALTTDRVNRLCDTLKIRVIDVGRGSGIEEMLKPEWLLGTEGLGGFCYGRHIPEYDGILAGLFVAEMIAKAVKPLSEITQEIWRSAGHVYYHTKDMAYDPATSDQSIKGLLMSASKYVSSIGKYHLEKYEVDGRTSGFKLLWGDCRWLMVEFLPFKSVTRLHVEGLSQEDVLTILDGGIKCLEV